MRSISAFVLALVLAVIAIASISAGASSGELRRDVVEATLDGDGAQQKPPAFTAIPAPDNVAKAPADAAKTPSGLSSIVLQAGTGKDKPGPTDIVTVNYTGWTTDGKMFDSSLARNAPSSFPVDRVIKGWGEGVQMMVVGEKRRFWIPGNLAYDSSPRPGSPKGMLVFDIELLEIR